MVLAGALSSGVPSKAEIFLPHPYTFAMMKLFAFRDRVEDADKDFGRYHPNEVPRKIYFLQRY
jgi:hypothetical protein